MLKKTGLLLLALLAPVDEPWSGTDSLENGVARRAARFHIVSDSPPSGTKLSAAVMSPAVSSIVFPCIFIHLVLRFAPSYAGVEGNMRRPPENAGNTFAADS